MQTWKSLLPAVVLTAAAGTSPAFNYDEGPDPDLRNIPQIPTVLTLELGTNTLVGGAGTASGPSDYDIFSFEIGEGMVLSSIFVDDYSNVNDGVSFIGMQLGTSWTAGLGNGVNGNLLAGWSLFLVDETERELLPTMSSPSNGSSGFQVPLGPGNYTFLLQDTGDRFSYGLTFMTTVVPLPPAVGLMMPALALLFALRGTAARRRVSR